MMNRFVKKLNTGTLAGLLMFLNAGIVKADCASMYRRNSKVYINVQVTAANGMPIYFDRQSNEPDFVRTLYVRAADLLEQAKRPNGGEEFNKMVIAMAEKHLQVPASRMEKHVREILIDAEKQSLFCRDTDGDGAPDLTSFRKIKKHVDAEVTAHLQ
ncbi:MAG: hypothetical protein HYW49_07170 [Deltaproteobacteria bacterium]|nr:hypothetical protein [Deltaproteobacteria bacterium]